jgi:hypothetical protein
LGQDGSKGGLGGLDNLSKGDGTHTHGKDRGGVGTHEAKGDGKHFFHVSPGNFGLGTSIGSQPKENTVQATNTQLHTRNGHGEASLSTSGVQSELVGNIVLREKFKKQCECSLINSNNIHIFGNHNYREIDYLRRQNLQSFQVGRCHSFWKDSKMNKLNWRMNWTQPSL